MSTLERFFDGRAVRIVVDDGGAVWFVARDVATALGYAWDTHLIDKVPPEWRGVKRIRQTNHGGSPVELPDIDVNVLSEQGLYFFLARSDKPKALPFQKHVAGEILPSIRKTGSYVATNAAPEIDVSDPTQLAPLTLKLAQYCQEIQRQLAEAKPKVESFDAFMTTEGTYSLRDTAKLLGMQPSKLNFWLLANKIVYRASDGVMLPYQPEITRGHFVVRAGSHQAGDQQRTHRQSRVTPKGVDYLRGRLTAPEGQLALVLS